ncbi:MAG: hypothetical protein WAN93_07335 [Solirubrobacteraceae bacterium]
MSLVLAVVCVVCGIGVGGPAWASHNQTTFFEAPHDLLDPKTRPSVVAEMRHLGVKAIRVELHWHDVAPAANSAKRPNFDATSPENYNWGQYDVLLAEAQRLGLHVLLTVTSPVPRWATSNLKAPYLTRPSDLDFRQFMTAVGKHYGSEISLYAIWNEPNISGWLRPQFNANGAPASPRIYRGLFEAGYEGLKAAGLSDPKILMGETAPFGSDTVNVRQEGAGALLGEVAPLAFLRQSLCLDSNYRMSNTCAELPIYGYAHHPYTHPSRGVLYRPPEKDQVTIGTLWRLSSALDAAARAHAIPRHVPIYLTEFGIQSKPNVLGVSRQAQAEDDAIAEKIAWSNPRVVSFSQYLMHDDPLSGSIATGGGGAFVGFQTGLETQKGVRKPIYYEFPLPLVVSRSRHGYSLWGLVRPAQGITQVRVLVEPKGSKHYRFLKMVQTGPNGYWTLHSPVSGSRWRVSWRSPSGVLYNGSSTTAS